MIKNCRMCKKILECHEVDLDTEFDKNLCCFAPSVTYEQTIKVLRIAERNLNDRDKRLKEMFLHGLKVDSYCRTCKNVRQGHLDNGLYCNLDRENTVLNADCSYWELDGRIIKGD